MVFGPVDGAAFDAWLWVHDLKDQNIDLGTNARYKVLEEAKEFADQPSLEEAADVFISLMASLVGHGWTVDDLAMAVHEKMVVNRNRTWERQPDGTYHHV